MEPILGQVRRAMERSGKTRYRLAREAGLAESQLSRLARGMRGLSVEGLERLAWALGFEVVLRPLKGRRGEKGKAQ